MVKNQRNAFIECIKRHDKHILHVCLAAQLQRQLNTALITRTSGPDRLEPSSHAQLYIRNNNNSAKTQRTWVTELSGNLRRSSAEHKLRIYVVYVANTMINCSKRSLLRRSAGLMSAYLPDLRHWACTAKTVMHHGQTYGYLPICTASPPFSW